MSKPSAALLLAVLVGVPQAPAQPALSVLRGGRTAVVAETLEVPIVLVTGGARLEAAAVDLHFDAGRAIVSRVIPGPDLPEGLQLAWNLVAPGHARLATVGSGTTIPGGTLAVVEIEPLVAGSLTLAMACAGADAEAGEIVVRCEDAFLFIQDAAASADIDADGIAEAADNCPGLANGDQADFDSDGTGDACDPCVHFAPDAAGTGCDFTWGDIAPRAAPDGRVDVADAVRALRVATGLDVLPLLQQQRANVAPAIRVPGEPETWRPVMNPVVIDVGDVVMILRTATGLTQLTRPD